MMKIQNDKEEREKYADYEYETAYPKHLPDVKHAMLIYDHAHI
jgi:hypothetical protein